MADALKNKVDFALVFTARNANPNGDPLDGNRPRTTYGGEGEVSDVCIKRKIRNRWIDEGFNVFVQSDDRCVDGCRSLKERVENCEELKKIVDLLNDKKKKSKKATSTDTESSDETAYEDLRTKYADTACKEWIDVRAFGQVFSFSAPSKSAKKEDNAEGDDDESAKKNGKGTSIGIRGPVSIQTAFTKEPINIISTQITKSVNLETSDTKGSDTMGMKHRVEYGVYATYGSINVQLAEKTGFSDDDAAALKEALRTLFRNDASAARPDGCMEVVKLIWWAHNCACGQYSSAKVHRSLKIDNTTDANSVPIITVDESDIPGLKYEIIDGE